ncbi:MAG: glutaredoxin [Gammaproteobacteria bacterium]|nr:glutaredoxin [Gammaproteobacteria bacterium]
MKYFFRYFFRTLRIILGPILLLWDWITSPAGIKRSPEEQQDIDNKTGKLVLYQFRTCPFCIKARRAIKRLSLKIELRDALRNKTHRSELSEGGGQIKVPCLRIENDSGDYSWLYESDDIIEYLQKNFSS